MHEFRELIAAMEEAISFHDDLAKLLTWLDGAELRLTSLPAADHLRLDDITTHLEALHRLKDDVDQHAIIKCFFLKLEQLSHSAAQIAAGASAHHAAAIRHPISEMNTRWTRLYGTLSDREYKVYINPSLKLVQKFLSISFVILNYTF
uniref:Dystrophin n=1 Tax=Heterorhabditis bacteriophora TaxID=37862 RepID=A0A1I7XH80_HETBA